MLKEIFNPERIKLDLKGSSITEVIKELTETIAESNSQFDGQKLFEAVIIRENKMNTVIKPGVAVPHGYCSSIQGIIGAMGYSRSGIEYNNLEKEPVHLFFLLIMDDSSRERHLRVLIKLWDLLNSADFAEIYQKGTPQEVYNLLQCF